MDEKNVAKMQRNQTCNDNKNENLKFNQKPFDEYHLLLSNCKMIWCNSSFKNVQVNYIWDLIFHLSNEFTFFASPITWLPYIS